MQGQNCTKKTPALYIEEKVFLISCFNRAFVVQHAIALALGRTRPTD